jgi:hypothetical protein
LEQGVLWAGGAAAKVAPWARIVLMQVLYWQLVASVAPMVQRCTIGAGCTMRRGRWWWGEVGLLIGRAAWMVQLRKLHHGVGSAWRKSFVGMCLQALHPWCNDAPSGRDAPWVKRRSDRATKTKGGTNTECRLPNAELWGGEIVCALCTIGAGRMVRAGALAVTTMRSMRGPSPVVAPGRPAATCGRRGEDRALLAYCQVALAGFWLPVFPSGPGRTHRRGAETRRRRPCSSFRVYAVLGRVTRAWQPASKAACVKTA